MPRKVTTLTLDDVQRIINNVLMAAALSNQEPQMDLPPIAVAVVGSDGYLIAFMAMDGVMPLSIRIAQNKAYTAVMGKGIPLYGKTGPILTGEIFLTIVLRCLQEAL